MKFLARLGFHAREINVSVSPETLVFHEQSLRIVLPAAAPLEASQLQRRLRAVAALVPTAALPLFPVASSNESASVTALRYVALVAVLDAGMAAILKERVVKRRPHLSIGGAASLESSLHGYQYELLRRAAFDAGALTVSFYDPTGSLPTFITERKQDPRTLRHGV